MGAAVTEQRATFHVDALGAYTHVDTPADMRVADGLILRTNANIRPKWIKKRKREMGCLPKCLYERAFESVCVCVCASA